MKKIIIHFSNENKYLETEEKLQIINENENKAFIYY